ncbi:hypothetical protein QNM99_17315, partial [Pseudomonas sp. PCH446]
MSDENLASSTLGSSLQRAGYQDIRQANDGILALEQVDQRAASLLICAGIAGLALAAKVRQRDEMNDHYTYVILISDQSPRCCWTRPRTTTSTTCSPRRCRAPPADPGARRRPPVQHLAAPAPGKPPAAPEHRQPRTAQPGDSLTGLAMPLLRQKLADSLRQSRPVAG